MPGFQAHLGLHTPFIVRGPLNVTALPIVKDGAEQPARLLWIGCINVTRPGARTLEIEHLRRVIAPPDPSQIAVGRTRSSPFARPIEVDVAIVLGGIVIRNGVAAIVVGAGNQPGEYPARIVRVRDA